MKKSTLTAFASLATACAGMSTAFRRLLAIGVVCVGLVLFVPAASAHTCGRVEGVKIHAYNLGCTRARSIYGGQPPSGWTAANKDVAGGLAFYCRAADEEVVDEAIDPRTGRVRVGRLHGAPLIIAAVPYGE